MAHRPIAGRARDRRPSIPGALVLLALLPVGAAGDRCDAGSGGWSAGIEAGSVWYGMAGGVAGVAWGPDVAHAGDRVAVRLGYRRVQLRAGHVTPDVVSGSVRAGVGSALGARVCATLHGGGSHFAGAGDSGTVLAGGAGLALVGRASLADAPVFPFFELRGLGARSDATVLGISTEGSGLSLGIEAGALARLGRVGLRAVGSLDGFAGGLGVTPYPGRSIRLGLDYRF